MGVGAQRAKTLADKGRRSELRQRIEIHIVDYFGRCFAGPITTKDVREAWLAGYQKGLEHGQLELKP